jgi:hypothetical protein
LAAIPEGVPPDGTTPDGAVVAGDAAVLPVPVLPVPVLPMAVLYKSTLVRCTDPGSSRMPSATARWPKMSVTLTMNGPAPAPAGAVQYPSEFSTRGCHLTDRGAPAPSGATATELTGFPLPRTCSASQPAEADCATRTSRGLAGRGSRTSR